MKGRVESVELNPSGKSWKVRISGQRYVFVGDPAPKEGKDVEFTYSDEEYQGRHFKKLKDFSYTGGTAAPSGDSDIPPDLARLMSNVIANAAQNDTVNYENVGKWMKNIYRAWHELDKPEQPDDDEMEF